MEETLNYCIHGTQAYAELSYSPKAVTRQGLSISFVGQQQGVLLCYKPMFVLQKSLAPVRREDCSKVAFKENKDRVYAYESRRKKQKRKAEVGRVSF